LVSHRSSSTLLIDSPSLNLARQADSITHEILPGQ